MLLLMSSCNNNLYFAALGQINWTKRFKSCTMKIQQLTIPENYKEENFSGLKILLVEDNLINSKVAEQILKQWDVEVDVAFNGQIAVDKLKDNGYDLILMDLSMPVMDGYEATTIIRRGDSLIPIIAMTATTSYQSLEKAMQIGMNEYIIKPFNPGELNSKLSKYYKF